MSASPTTGLRDLVSLAASLAPALFAEAASVDRDGGFPQESVELLRRSGLLAAPLRERQGGCGLGRADELRTLLEVLAELGRGSLPVGRIYEGHVNALLLIDAFGSPGQVARYADDAATGHLFGVWNTQGEQGVEVRPLSSERHAMSGCKTFATAAGFVSRAVVTAGDGRGGWQMLVVPTDVSPPAIDRSFWKPLGMRATASFLVDFTGIDVTTEEFLGAPGDYYAEPAFSGGAVRFSAVQLGGVEAVFDETREFLRSAGRIEDPYQRARVGEMAALVASGRQWLRGAATQVGIGQRTSGRVADALSASDGLVAHAHLMRASIETIALRVMRLAERSVGARGLLRPAPFERLHRDLTHYLRQANADGSLAIAGDHVLSRTEPASELWNERPVATTRG